MRKKWEELVTFVSRDWPDNCIDRKISGKYYLDAILYADRRIKALEKVREAAEKVVKMNELILETEEFIAIHALRVALAAAKEDSTTTG